MSGLLREKPCFGDLFELDRVCGILREYAQAFEDDSSIDVAPFRAPKGVLASLVERIKKQERWHRESSEVLYRPGAFDRSYLLEEYQKAHRLAASVMDHPSRLPDEIDDLIICLHRVTILAFLPEDQLRAAMKEQSDKARATVANRHDQQMKAEFLPWAERMFKSGMRVKNVRELERLAGFRPEWSTMADDALKAWARTAGFSFVSGRPKKK